MSNLYAKEFFDSNFILSSCLKVASNFKAKSEFLDRLLLPYKSHGSAKLGIYLFIMFIFASCEPLTIISGHESVNTDNVRLAYADKSQ